MAKFLKFNIVNTGALLTQGVQLVNVEDIESVSYAAGTGILSIQLQHLTGIASAQTATVVPPMTSDGETSAASIQATYTVGAVAQGVVAGRLIQMLIKTVTSGAVAIPLILNGASAPDKAVYAAMTANPGGVQSTVQLGRAETSAAVPVALQMYISSFAISTVTVA